MAEWEAMVVPDELMPAGHEWVRVRRDDGSTVTYLAESSTWAQERRVRCSDGVPLSA